MACGRLKMKYRTTTNQIKEPSRDRILTIHALKEMIIVKEILKRRNALISAVNLSCQFEQN